MADKYDFGNLTPIEFESLTVDLVSTELGLPFESFSPGPDGGIDGRHSSAAGSIILQSKHYKNSTWNDLLSSAKRERKNVSRIDPTTYYFATSQSLSPDRKNEIVSALNHRSVSTGRILGRSELNLLLTKHGQVEKRNIKLWLSSTAVLQRILTNDIAVFTEATHDSIERILKVFVSNPSVKRAADTLNHLHCLIISGPPGVGKTTLAQVLAAEYCDEGWEIVSLSEVDDGFRAFDPEKRQVFIFDDFLGKIKLELHSLTKDDRRITAFLRLISKRKDKRFILTTRGYILESARTASEALDDDRVRLVEIVLDLSVYTREIKARILYNHLYHSSIDDKSLSQLLEGETVAKIVDHRNYMPRIVEWMTDHLQFQGVHTESYPDRFLRALDNPRKIWDKAFKHHISSQARVLLYCMYFSKPDRLGRLSVDLTTVGLFFKRAMSALSIEKDRSIKNDGFEAALREIKSSFVVFDGARVSFINPSVQDYLSGEVDDEVLLEALVRSAPTFGTVISIWETAVDRLSKRPSLLKTIAVAVLDSFRQGSVTDRVTLDTIAPLLGQLLTISMDLDFVEFLRRGGLANRIWVSSSDLPALIESLLEGPLSEIPYGILFGRYLRRRLFVYVAQREYIIDLDDLARLSSNMSRCRVEFSDAFLSSFEDAIVESVETLDPNALSSDNAESTISAWLESLDEVSRYCRSYLIRSKLGQLQDHMREIERNAELEEERQSYYLRRSASSGVSPGVVGSQRSGSVAVSGFSNNDLDNLFSSLKK